MDGSAVDTLVAEAWGDSFDLLRTARIGDSVRPQTAALVGVDQAAPPDDRFRLGSVLGIGGTSTVYQAEQVALGRQVAVKVALTGVREAAFRAEAATAAELEHPNIVPVYDAGPLWMAMKRIRGRNLEELMRTGAVDLAGAVEALVRVCDALAFAHSRGVIHRDIKPENILLGPYGEVLLTDWGLALAVEDGPDGRPCATRLVDVVNITAGTPGYLSPEIALGSRASVNRASDVFLLGATLYRCVTGRIPFQADTAIDAVMLAAWNRHPPVREVRPDAPPRLVAIIERCMLSDPHQRPRVADVQDGLRRWLRQSQGEAEARRLVLHAQDLMTAAAAQRRPEESYARYGEAVSLLDRAQVLAPDDAAIPRLAQDALRDFMLAAAAAGEPGLARLLRRGVRLPAVTTPEVSDNQQIATLQRERIHLMHRVEEAERSLAAERQRQRACRGTWWWLLAGALLAGMVLGVCMA